MPNNQYLKAIIVWNINKAMKIFLQTILGKNDI